MKRKDFIKASGLAGMGLIIPFTFIPLHGSARDTERFFEPNAFIEVRHDNSVQIIAKNPEIGQGVKTSLPMIIAEEMEVDWQNIKIIQGEYRVEYGSQFAGGSTAITSNFESMRKAGAQARMVLLSAASNLLELPLSEVYAEKGRVYSRRDNRSLTYGELVEEAINITIPENPDLKDPSEFTLLGTFISGTDNHDIVTGAAKYGIDYKQEGTLYAAIAKSPFHGGSLVSFDDSRTRNVEGVVDVVRLEGMDNPMYMKDGVAVLATNTWAAMKGLNQLSTEWSPLQGQVENSEALDDHFNQQLQKGEFTTVRDDGDIDKALDESTNIYEATYQLPFLAHAAMEPINYFADIPNKFITGPTQVPGLSRALAANVTGLEREEIQLTLPRIGGGFGRRLVADYSPEAATLSKMKNAPVHVVWTREQDTQNDYYRPAGVYQLKCGVDSKGFPKAWHVKACSTSRYMYAERDEPPHGTEVFPDGFPAKLISDFKMEYVAADSNIPIGAWRAPGHNSTAFVDQCFLDEIAAAEGLDPIELRLRLLGKDREISFSDHGGPFYSTAKLKNVIQRAVQESNWYSLKENGKALGFAAHFTFGSYVALVTELKDPVSSSGMPAIEKMTAVVDCGIVVNKSGAMAQVEGAIIDGLGTAMYGEITIQNGGTAQRNFDGYQLIRMEDVPPIDIHFIESTDHPEGLGEVALPVAAPSYCNAIFAATGKRIRKLPIKAHL